MKKHFMTVYCNECGEEYSMKRYRLGYKLCLDCGDTIARKHKHTIVPMHKSNYVVVTNRQELLGLTKVNPTQN